MTRLLSWAAGMALDVPPVAAAAAAAAAGFGAIGVRFAAPGPSEADVAALRRRVDDLGIAVLDVEYGNLTADDHAAGWHRRLVEIAAALDAGHVLVISSDPDRDRAAERLAALADHATAAGGPPLALEFMRFTEVRRLSDALDVLARSGLPAGRAGVLVDALHLARGGDDPGALAAADPALLPYLQVCDAPADPPGDGDDDRALGHEARHTRLLPGDGALPLTALLAAAPPHVPLSVEVLSDDLRTRLPPRERAQVCLDATRRLLEA